MFRIFWTWGGVYGVDNDPISIQHAHDNFKLVQNLNNFSFVVDDMRLFAKNKKNILTDVFVLASAAYYISREDLSLLMVNMVNNNNIKDNAKFYIRVRSKKDFRYGYGKKIAPSRFEMPEDSVTGENCAKIEFYSENEIVSILKNKLNLKDYDVMISESQNEQNGMNIFNSDIIIWGVIN